MEHEKTDWDRIVEEMWQEEAQIQATMPRPRAVRVMPDTFAGITPGTLFNPHAHSDLSWFDMGEEIPQPKPNQEVSNMKLEDTTQGLPIVGLRVMINPEKFGDYPREFHGMSGTITDVQGSHGGCQKVIRGYKRVGNINNDSWTVKVKFENGRIKPFRVRDLIPIHNNHQNLHKVYTDQDDTALFLTQEEYDAYIMKRVIMRGEKLIKDELYDDEYRRKIFDEA